jgi:hypothetical protein
VCRPVSLNSLFRIALSRWHDATTLVLLVAGADLDHRNTGGMCARMFVGQGIVQSPALLASYAKHAEDRCGELRLVLAPLPGGLHEAAFFPPHAESPPIHT